jgi:hypothetical protein
MLPPFLTVQVFVGGQLIGGATELQRQLADGSLATLLASETLSPPLPEDLRGVLLADTRATAGSNDDISLVESAEREALAPLADSLRQSSQRGAAFSLRAALDALQAGGTSATLAIAISTLARMQSLQLITLASTSQSYPQADAPINEAMLTRQPNQRLRLVADPPPLSSISQPLNAGHAWFGPARSARSAGETVRRLVLRLYDAHMSLDGKRVDYNGMRSDPGFQTFVVAATELQKVDVAALSRQEATAFWINLYNALVVHALVEFGPAKNTLERLTWFDKPSYVVGGARFSLNDIEHGVLRCNAPSPGSTLSLLGLSKLAPPTFSKGDPRLILALPKPVDPRIHFALNCGATSCPPVRVYSADRLDAGLEAAAEAFCAGEVQVDPAAGNVRLSSIFKWYGKDFGSKVDLLRFLVDHLQPGPAAELHSLVERDGAGGEGITLEYAPYDWGLNSK